MYSKEVNSTELKERRVEKRKRGVIPRVEKIDGSVAYWAKRYEKLLRILLGRVVPLLVNSARNPHQEFQKLVWTRYSKKVQISRAAMR